MENPLSSQPRRERQVNQNRRHKWISRLARDLLPSAPARCEAALIHYLPQLNDEFPDEAFTRRSLTHVAKEKYWENIPTYAQLHSKLMEYLEKEQRNARPLPVLAVPLRPAPRVRTPEEIAYVEQKRLEATRHLRAVSCSVYERGLSKAPANRPENPDGIPGPASNVSEWFAASVDHETAPEDMGRLRHVTDVVVDLAGKVTLKHP